MEQTVSKAKILLVEDEPHLAFNLNLNLKAEGYEVTHVISGADALDKYRTAGPFDLIVLDIMIPEPDGFQVAKTIREKDEKTAIIVLTARAGDNDRLRGLSLGVDDYICKPFHLQEFLLKVKRATKRSELIPTAEHGSSPEGSGITAGPFHLDREALELKTPGASFSVTALEADMLFAFMSHPNKVLSREYLLSNVWKIKGHMETRTVDNFVMRLRRYLEEEPNNPRILESVRGRGYRFKI